MEQLYKITETVLNDIFENTENIEYLTWTDGTEITRDELSSDFAITTYRGMINLEHMEEDFRIEDIVLTGKDELIKI